VWSSPSTHKSTWPFSHQFNLPASASFGNIPDPQQKQAFLQDVISRIEPFTDQWRKDAVKEIRQLLSTALKLPDGF
jgi:hypothetical protein